MGNHSIDKIKDRQLDVKQKLETKKGKLNQLEQRKQSLLDTGTEVQGSDMDSNAIRTIMDLINKELEQNAEKGQELSNEMQNDFESLEDMKNEVGEMKEGTEQNRQKLENKKTILDKFGLGKNIDTAISEMENSQAQLNELGNNLVETEKDLSETSQRLGSL